MTMQIVVKNEDQHRTAKVVEQDFEKETGKHTDHPMTLGPGESRSFWIHASKRLVIDEEV